uniref:Uncharacterized protein n=1 Tax=Siphoviridae sp. ct3CA7 TaxID=2823561 RepID=A0A8S5LEU5_9CAUD|nr:MAG TPA: hypothetical protein [Siphoviridae sp. ct3CA7]
MPGKGAFSGLKGNLSYGGKTNHMSSRACLASSRISA